MPMFCDIAHNLRTEMDLTTGNWSKHVGDAALLGRACGFLVEMVPNLHELRINPDNVTAVMHVPLSDVPSHKLEAMADDFTKALGAVLEGEEVELRCWK